MRPGTPCFSAAQSPEVAKTLQACADNIGAPFHLAGRDFEISPQGDGGAVSPCPEQQHIFRARVWLAHIKWTMRGWR